MDNEVFTSASKIRSSAAFGEIISGREILLLDGVRTDVYYFTDEAMATRMADGIMPGGT